MIATPITYALRALSMIRPIQKPLVFSGPDSILKLADLMISSGQKRPLLITSDFFLKNSMLDHLLQHLENHDCQVTTYAEVQPNPTLAQVEDALKTSLDNNCDSVFAIGGGSVIDVAKVVAAASTNDKSLERLIGILKVKQAPLPFYAVPTTSGSGSETTIAAVVSDTETHKKKFFIDSKYIPIATALDPNLLKSLPAPMTATIGIDALTHAIEAYTSRNNFPDTDRDAAIAIKLLFEFLPIAYQDGNNLHAREMVAQASFLAGYALAKAGLGYVHAISHQISGHYDTPHGLANAILLPKVMHFNQSACSHQYSKLEKMLDDTSEDNHDLSYQFIQRVEQLIQSLDIPSQLDELKEKDFDQIAKDALNEAWRTHPVPKVMRRHDVKAILHAVAAN